MEAYANPTVLNGTAGNSAPVGGKRHRKATKKALRKLKGGLDAAASAVSDMAAATAPEGGKRRRHHRKGGRKTRRGKSLLARYL